VPTIQLSGSAQVTLDGTGAGDAVAGPTLPGTSWTITGVAVSVATNVNEAICRAYAAAAGPFPAAAGQLLGATSTGSTGDSFGPDVTIYPGQALLCAWQQGDAGQVATMRYWGTQDVP
jgi:hypothetical protein